MSELVEKRPCPCGTSSDAFAVYDSGWGHCFRCEKNFKADGTGHKEVSEDKSVNFVDYEPQALAKRRISEKTAQRFSYGVGSFKGKTVQVANYFDINGKRVGQKIRFPNKDFLVVGKVTDTLYGMHLWKDGGKRVVVTEGEMDALSYAEATGCSWPVVSIPSGAAAAKKAVEKHIEWLERFEEVVFLFDNDEPGQEAALECAEVLTPGRAKIGVIPKPYKDASDMLVAGEYKPLMNVVYNARTHRPDDIMDATTLWDRLNDTTSITTIEYPWTKLNFVTRGLRKGELVTLTAGSGIGKSAICREIIYDLLNKGMKVGAMFLEENVTRTARGIMGLHLNVPIHLGEHEVSQDDLEAAFDATVGSGRLYLYDHFGSVDVDNLMSRVRYMVKAYGVDYVFIDHLSIVISGLEINDERRALDVAMTRLRTLVEETGVGMVVVSHLKRPTQSDQGHENGLDPQLSHLRGSHSIAQLSDMVIGASRNQQDEENADKTKLIVLKNRFSGETGFAGMLKYNRETGRLAEVDADDFADDDPTDGSEDF